MNEVKETQPTPEQRVSKVVSQADALFVREGMPRVPGQRGMICGLAADVITRVATKDGGLESNGYNLRNVHKQMGIANKYDAFQHEFNLLRAGPEPYLVDIAFCQFLDPKTGEIRQSSRESTYIPYADNSLAQQLLDKGYFLLTDEALRDYLNMSSVAQDKSYIQTATLERLLAVDPKLVIHPPDHDDAVLDRYLEGEAVWPWMNSDADKK